MSMVQIQILGLIACRVFSFMSVAPILSERNFPNLCKLILGGGLILSAFSLAAAFEKKLHWPSSFDGSQGNDFWLGDGIFMPTGFFRGHDYGPVH